MDKKSLSERDICTKFITPALRKADRTLVLDGRTKLENGGAKLDHRAANRSCFWAE